MDYKEIMDIKGSRPSFWQRARGFVLLNQIREHPEQVDWEKAKEEVEVIGRILKNSPARPLTDREMRDAHNEARELIRLELFQFLGELVDFAYSSMTYTEFSEDEQEELDDLEKEISWYRKNEEDLSKGQWIMYEDLLNERGDIYLSHRQIDESIRKEKY